MTTLFIFAAVVFVLLEWIKTRNNRSTSYTTEYKSEPPTPHQIYFNPYQFFLGSDEWKAIRDNLFILRGKQCERCRSTYNIQVHHLNYNKPWGQEEPEDLEILCETCHKKEHGL